eukprot:GHVO01032702.1.p1 GENE.GHVO01032702.1~~GHVO01032702.1.p1  ORF type:complete len:308 (-),score=38.55 GHVO01032702.1:85-1008(-)
MFEALEFREAKDELWKRVEEERSDCDIIGEKQNRNDSSSRTAAKAHCQDVLRALKELEDAGALPGLAVCVEDLKELPPIAPAISHQKRQRALDTQVSNIEDELHQSQDEVKQTLTSIQEAQKMLSEDMTELRRRLDDPVFLGPQSSTPNQRRHGASIQSPPRPTLPEVRGESGPRGPRNRRTDSAQAGSGSQWNTVVRNKRKKKVVTGTQECEEAFSGAPEVRNLFVWNVAKNAEVEKVRKHIEDRCDGVVNVRVWSHPDAPLKSFKVTVLKDSVKTLLCSDFPWPRLVKVRRFVPGRGPPPVHTRT